MWCHRLDQGSANDTESNSLKVTDLLDAADEQEHTLVVTVNSEFALDDTIQLAEGINLNLTILKHILPNNKSDPHLY